MRSRIHFVCDRRSMLSHFSFGLLRSRHDLLTSYALRFQVYCAERGLLPAANYPDGVESDDLDARSLHFGAFYCADESMAGTVRLILGGLDRLPVATKCAIDPALMPRAALGGSVAEISRLAVSRHFRRRDTDGVLPDERAVAGALPASRRELRRGCPELVLGLYKAMYHETKRRGIEYWFAAMEHSLARLLQRFNFSFHPVGPEVDYYGPVTPYVARIDDLEAEVFANRPELLREMADGLEPWLMPAQLRPRARPLLPAPAGYRIAPPRIAATATA